MESSKYFFIATILLLSYSVIVSEQVQNCGGIFSGYQYTIRSPNYPNHYTSDQNCVYTLTGNQLPECEAIFYLQFLDFDLQASENCQAEYLKVGDRHIYCGNARKFKKFIGKNGVLQAVFHTSNENVNHRGFKILVTVECATDYEINAKRNRSENSTELDQYYTHRFYEGNINSVSNEKSSTDPKSKNNDITTYFFLPPSEKNNSNSAIKFATESEVQMKKPTEVPHRNSNIQKPEIEPLAMVFNPNCEQPFNDHEQKVNSRLNTGIYSTVSGQNPGSYNNYYPNINPNVYNTVPNNFNYQNNFVPINPPNSYPDFGYSSIDGVNNNYPTNNYPANNYPANNYPTNNYPFVTGSECCGTIYSAPRFLISSPGFPNLGHGSNSYDCGYTIQRSSPLVCQLRLNFKFFNLGSNDAYCSNGYLDVDGQKFCGCRTGFSVVSPFNNIATKRLNVRYTGVPRSKFNGFLIEVIQENCNYNYNYNYRFKRDTSMLNNDREKRQLGYSYSVPNRGFIEGNFYFGGYGRENYASICESRLFFDWVVVSKEVYLRNARCQSNNLFPRNNMPFAKLVSSNKDDNMEENDIGNCEIVREKKGVLSSLGYPARYADNSHKCYRFEKQEGFCKLDLLVLDFDLEPSQECEKDFVEFSTLHKRFCSQMLIGQKLNFDLSNVNPMYMNFTADAHKNGRGFSIAYEQVTC